MAPLKLDCISVRMEKVSICAKMIQTYSGRSSNLNNGVRLLFRLAVLFKRYKDRRGGGVVVLPLTLQQR